MGFWKKRSERQPANSPADEETYALEWRTRYLLARKTHLWNALIKAGLGVPELADLPENPEARNRLLEAQIKQLEDMS